MPLRLLAAFCVAALFAAPAAAQENPNAKVLHMQPHGEWEAWCVKRHVEAKPDCFVANAVVYSPRPNFAAIVLYFRPPGLQRDETEVRLGLEAQSLLAPGHVRIDGQDALDTNNCLLPGSCTLSGAKAAALIAKMTAGEAMAWRHIDNLTKNVDLEMDLKGFAAAFAEVEAWTEKLATE